jgi:hypothetical protein
MHQGRWTACEAHFIATTHGIATRPCGSKGFCKAKHSMTGCCCQRWQLACAAAATVLQRLPKPACLGGGGEGGGGAGGGGEGGGLRDQRPGHHVGTVQHSSAAGAAAQRLARRCGVACSRCWQSGVTRLCC